MQKPKPLFKNSLNPVASERYKMRKIDNREVMPIQNITNQTQSTSLMHSIQQFSGEGRYEGAEQQIESHQGDMNVQEGLYPIQISAKNNSVIIMPKQTSNRVVKFLANRAKKRGPFEAVKEDSKKLDFYNQSTHTNSFLQIQATNFPVSENLPIQPTKHTNSGGFLPHQ